MLSVEAVCDTAAVRITLADVCGHRHLAVAGLGGADTTVYQNEKYQVQYGYQCTSTCQVKH